MPKLAVIDWSYVTMKVWQSLATKKIPWTRPSEAEEGIHRICEWVYALYVEHAWDKLIIAKDTPRYWRHDVVEAFNASIPRHMDPETGQFFVKYDGVLQQIPESSLSLVKPPSAEAKKIMKRMIQTEDAPAHPLNKYKGNRRTSDSWSAETPIEMFYTIRDRLADRIALLVKGKVVEFVTAEADDIAAVVANITANTGVEVVLISGDGDWKQLLLQGTHVKLHDVYHNHRLEFNDELKAGIEKELKIKVLGGDPGDNIKGLPYNTGKSGCIAKDGAVKHIEAGLGFGNFDPLYLKRNMQLMMLTKSQLPVHVWQGVEAALKAPSKTYSSPPMSWADLGLNDKERERIEISGGAARIFSTWKSAPAKVAASLKVKAIKPEPLDPETAPEVVHVPNVITGGTGIYSTEMSHHEVAMAIDPVTGVQLEKDELPF